MVGVAESNPNPNPNPSPYRPPSLHSSVELEDSNGGQGRTDREVKKKRKIDELEDTAKGPEVETLEGSSHDGLGNDSSSNAVQRAFKCNFCHREFSTPQALGGHQNAHKMDRALMKQQREIEGMHPHFLPYYHPFNYYNAMSSRSMYEPLKGIVPNNRSIYEPFKAAPFGLQLDPNRSMYEPFKGTSLVDPSIPHLNWGTMPYPNRAYNLSRLRQGMQVMGGLNQTRPSFPTGATLKRSFEFGEHSAAGVVSPSDQTDMPLAKAPLQVSTNATPHENKDPQQLDLSLKL